MLLKPQFHKHLSHFKYGWGLSVSCKRRRGWIQMIFSSGVLKGKKKVVSKQHCVPADSDQAQINSSRALHPPVCKSFLRWLALLSFCCPWGWDENWMAEPERKQWFLDTGQMEKEEERVGKWHWSTSISFCVLITERFLQESLTHAADLGCFNGSQRRQDTGAGNAPYHSVSLSAWWAHGERCLSLAFSGAGSALEHPLDEDPLPGSYTAMGRARARAGGEGQHSTVPAKPRVYEVLGSGIVESEDQHEREMENKEQ